MESAVVEPSLQQLHIVEVGQHREQRRHPVVRECISQHDAGEGISDVEIVRFGGKVCSDQSEFGLTGPIRMLAEEYSVAMNVCVSKRNSIDTELLSLLKADAMGSVSKFRTAIPDRPVELMDGVLPPGLKSGYKPVSVEPKTHTGVPGSVMRP